MIINQLIKSIIPYNNAGILPVVSDSLFDPWIVGCQAPLSRGFPDKDAGVGCHFFLQLQGIFPTQGLNPRLLHWQDSLMLGHQGSLILPLSLHINLSSSEGSPGEPEPPR